MSCSDCVQRVWALTTTVVSNIDRGREDRRKLNRPSFGISRRCENDFYVVGCGSLTDYDINFSSNCTAPDFLDRVNPP